MGFSCRVQRKVGPSAMWLSPLAPGSTRRGQPTAGLFLRTHRHCHPLLPPFIFTSAHSSPFPRAPENCEEELRVSSPGRTKASAGCKSLSQERTGKKGTSDLPPFSRMGLGTKLALLSGVTLVLLVPSSKCQMCTLGGRGEDWLLLVLKDREKQEGQAAPQ